MRIKEHWRYRLASLVTFIGLVMVLLAVDPLIDYHKQTSAYFEEMSPLLDRMDRWSSQIQPQPDPQAANAELSEIHRDIRISHFFNKPAMEASRIPKYVAAQFHIGFVSLMLGLYFAEKYKPKPKEKKPDPEPTTPWDSLPAPELKKKSCDE